MPLLHNPIAGQASNELNASSAQPYFQLKMLTSTTSTDETLFSNELSAGSAVGGLKSCLSRALSLSAPLALLLSRSNPGNYLTAAGPQLLHPPAGPAPTTDKPASGIKFHQARRHGYNALDVLELVNVDVAVVDAAIKSIHAMLHKMAAIRKPPGFAPRKCYLCWADEPRQWRLNHPSGEMLCCNCGEHAEERKFPIWTRPAKTFA
ncbi:hypothetical protein IWZ00DRAFT_558034 [Phyllosticta capitalensis]